MRARGLTLLELMLALSVGAVVTLVISGLLVSGFDFAMETEGEEHVATGARALMERLVREIEEARGHEVFVDAGGALRTAGAPGACLKLYSSTGDSTWWWDPASSEIRYRPSAQPTGHRVGARGVQAFTVRCVQPERVEFSLTAGALTLTTSAWHRNYDGSRDSCALLRLVAGR